MSIFNKSPAGSVNLIFIASVKASYGMVGEEGEILEVSRGRETSYRHWYVAWVLRLSFLALRRIPSYRSAGSTVRS